jgi:hypothetical protein
MITVNRMDPSAHNQSWLKASPPNLRKKSMLLSGTLADPVTFAGLRRG